MRYKIIEKYLKKVLAEWEKGSTFAPAFGTEEGTKRGEHGSVKFFESLRPAQERSADAARRRAGRDHPGGDLRDGHRGGTRDSEYRKFEYNNTTTKSLILAQDER